MKGMINLAQGILYLVGTPIGNLSDLTPRALETLRTVDFVAAEDTRVTLRLLNHFDVKQPLESYFEHNRRQKGPQILARLLRGESCALVTDAGMPAISDPGEDLVSLCHENGVPVRVVPGPCAAVSALAASGLPTGRFCFEGFLSVNRRNRREHLALLVQEERTLIFYEAPHKLRTTLDDLLAAFGDRRVTLARELTKIHEEAVRTTLQEAVAFYKGNEPRGEYVLVVEGREPVVPSPADDAQDELKAQTLVQSYIAQGLSHTRAVRRAAAETKISRSELYRRTLQQEAQPDPSDEGKDSECPK